MKKLSELSDLVIEREEQLFERALNEKNFKILLEKFSRDNGQALCKKLENELVRMKPDVSFTRQEIGKLVKNVFEIR